MAKNHRLPLMSPNGLPQHVEPTSDDDLLQVGELARAVGKTVRAIHHYENVGLLSPHKRSKGRYRLYAPDAVSRVRWISKLHDLGMSLSEIQQIVSSWKDADTAPEAMGTIRDVYRQKLADVQSQISHLTSLERELRASLDYLDTCETTCDVDHLVGACNCCTVHEVDEPDLVAGLYAGQQANDASAVAE